MSRVPLIGGAYSARSRIAAAQRCLNLYPEKNPKTEPSPMTHYQRPGLRPLAQGERAPVRGLYRASNGNGYAVIGQSVYSIGMGFTLTKLGTLGVPGSVPTSMIDNATTLFLVDSSPLGYQINLGTNAFSQIVDPTGIFTGGTRVDYIDTFCLWGPLAPGSQAFGSTLSNEISFDATQIANKTDYPDPLATLIVNRHEILLIGTLKTEIWYDAGNPQFPFAELPGAYIEHGTGAPYSVAATDISVFWLSQDLQGQGMVLRQRGYETTRISNHALEYSIRKIAKRVGISDAIGYTYQQDGHVFYVLTFPSGDETWVFDEAIGEPEMAWHQRGWTDSNGLVHRDRTNCHAFIQGMNVVGDWENGTIYELDQDTYTDTLVPGGAPGPITFARAFPHQMRGADAQGHPVDSNGSRIQFMSFIADIACGEVPLNADGTPAQLSLRWSDNRGKSFGNPVKQTFGVPGQYETMPVWRNLGISRDRIYEISYSVAGEAPLNGAWIEPQLLGT